MSLEYIKTTPKFFKILDEIYSEKLLEGLTVKLPVNSNSMYPTIKAGNIVSIKRVDQYKKGDIVLVSRKDQFIVHRIKNINKDIVLTQGDNNSYVDSFVSVSSIKGKVTSLKYKKNIYDVYRSLFLVFRRKKNHYFFKFKNFIFKSSSNLILKNLLLIMYKIQINIVISCFRFMKDYNLYLRGSSVVGKITPGISDVDFVILRKNANNTISLLRVIELLSKVSPVIMFNSFLPIDLYLKLRRYGLLEDYNGNKVKKLTGELVLPPSKLLVKNDIEKGIDEIYTKLDIIDDLMFKFSQVGLYHPSYLYHNIKKLFNRYFNLFNLDEKLSKEKDYLNNYTSANDLVENLKFYAELIAILLKDVSVPNHSFEKIDFEKYFNIEIDKRIYPIFRGIRRFESYIVEDNFSAEDIYRIILYTIRETTFPYSVSIMTKEIACFMQNYSIDKILNEDFKYKNEFAKKLLLESILFFNNYNLVSQKDRFDIEKTCKEIIHLSFLFKSVDKTNINPLILDLYYDRNQDGHLSAHDFYIKYLEVVNDFFLTVELNV